VIPESKFAVVVVLGGLVSRYCLLLLRLDQIEFLYSLRLLFFIRFENSSDSSDWKLFVCLEGERGVWRGSALAKHLAFASLGKVGHHGVAERPSITYE